VARILRVHSLVEWKRRRAEHSFDSWPSACIDSSLGCRALPFIL
jgi:hypothetical protein